MFDLKADESALAYFVELRKKCKSEDDIGRAIDKAIDYYFEQKEKNLNGQKELDF